MSELKKATQLETSSPFPSSPDGIFDIRSHYRAIFPEPEFAEVDEDSANADKKLKFSKLRY